MSNLNEWIAEVGEKDSGRTVNIEPANDHDCNWKARVGRSKFYWKTKASAIKNLKRIFCDAREV